MSVRKQRKVRKNGKQEDAEMDIQTNSGLCQSAETVTMNVLIQNSQHIHFGSHNISVSELKSKDQQMDWDEELYLSYLSAKESKGNTSEYINIQTLETTFLKRQKTSKKPRSFKNVTNQKLLSYMQDRAELYSLNRHGDCWTVKPTTKAEQKYSPHGSSKTEEVENVDIYSTCTGQESAVGVTIKKEKPWYKTPTSATHLEAKDTSKGAIPKRYGTERKLFAASPAISSDDKMLHQLDLRPKLMLTPQQQMKNSSEEIQKLMTAAKDFEQGQYILINCEKERLACLEGLCLVPWLAVFDFDQKSRSSGLLSVIEKSVRKVKALNICTWKDPPRYNEGSVQWCFIRGCSDMPESLIDSESNKWNRDYQTSIESHLKKLEDDTYGYTNLTLLILWPEEEKVGNLTHHLFRFIMKMDELVEPVVSIILCDCGRIAKSNPFKTLIDLLNDEVTLIHLDIEQICRGLQSKLTDRNKKPAVTHELPTDHGTADNIITQEDAAWLRSEIEVLYKKSPFATSMDPDELQQECKAFFRGGTIKWPIWYVCGSGHLDAERDLLHKMVQRIKSCGESSKSDKIILLHAPGSGGTTCAQRLLWELKDVFPCAQAKLHTGTPISELVSRVEFLGSKTQRPVVLLVDGEEKQRVDNLRKMVKDVILIILYVERYIYSMEEKQSFGSEFWLQGRVSQSESNMFSQKFQALCDDENRKIALQDLSRDVKLGNTHYVYEFGLTAYEHEYKGVQSFVHGYLQLDKNPTADLLPWQTVLGYLSLVYYYGHSSVPCQFFADLLGFPPNATITIKDFDFPMREFVMPDRHEAKSNMIRICHVIIAKEILEQILTRHQVRATKECTETLSKDARSKMHTFAMELVEYASKKKVKAAISHNTVNEILTQIFIIRNSSCHEDPAAEFKQKYKPKLSQLMSDIECSKPYTERLNVFKKLTECFPNNPNFHAHLGRFFAIYRRDNVKDQEEAVKCFEGALRLCQAELAKNVEDVDDKMRVILKLIYHMYGMLYYWRISPYTGKRLGDKPDIRTANEQFENRAEELRQMVQTACFYFGESRRYCPNSAEDTYGYCSEITVRLQLSDFINRHIKGNIVEFIHTKKDNLSKVKCFIRESIGEIDDLIRECLSKQETCEIDPLLYECIKWYEELFKMKAADIRYFISPNNIPNRRLKIICRKLKYAKEVHKACLEYITTPEDIQEIVEDYEAIFNDIHLRDCEFSRKHLDMDYMEWISGIRHIQYKNNYDIETVLSRVKQWNNKVPESLYSKYYLFIMYSLLGLGPNGTLGSMEMMKRAIEVKEGLSKMSKTWVRSRYPLEWYGKGDGIKSLITGFHFSFEGRTPAEISSIPGEHALRLVVLKGTICRPNTGTLGHINLNIEGNTVPFHVAFLPKRYNLNGARYVGEKVEFLLGFSVFHGYEAFNVKVLQSFNCTNCNLSFEFKSDESLISCQCGADVYRTTALM
ncbi:hypothetical protein ACJMK2_043002 [Sinanodonta woodiana]|uniref:Sterile alpha motif domain-containing protein 9-like n=1 Tax=Sinanodonta woodiana TaxID=1069815 RepID=A0ABD3VWY9_SINWO